MTLDLTTMSLATAVVMVTAGVLYLTETLTHRTSPAARIWTAAFLAGTMTTLSYLAWALDPAGLWVAVAIGNGCFILGTGCLWLGCRRFNDHSVRIPGAIVAVTALAGVVAALLAGPTGGAWAGASLMFAGIAAFTGLGAVEARRGVLGRQSVVMAISLVLGAASVYYIARLVAFHLLGGDSPEFGRWFGTTNTSILSIVFTMATLVAMSVLRATESTLRGRGRAATLEITTEGLLDPSSFEAMLAGAAARGARHGDRIAVIALRMEELPRIATAFGSPVAATLTQTWRASLPAAAPLLALVGEEGRNGLLVALPVASASDARTVAARVRQRVLDDLVASGAPITPVIGVGVALTDAVGYDAADLIDASGDAARTSAERPDSAVVVAPSRGSVDSQPVPDAPDGLDPERRGR